MEKPFAAFARFLVFRRRITRITHSVAQAAAAVQASEMAMSIPAVLAGLTSEAVSSSLPAFASSSASSPVSTAGTRTLVDSCLSPPLTVYTAYTSGEVPRTYRSGSSSDTETSCVTKYNKVRNLLYLSFSYSVSKLFCSLINLNSDSIICKIIIETMSISI